MSSILSNAHPRVWLSEELTIEIVCQTPVSPEVIYSDMKETGKLGATSTVSIDATPTISTNRLTSPVGLKDWPLTPITSDPMGSLQGPAKRRKLLSSLSERRHPEEPLSTRTSTLVPATFAPTQKRFAALFARTLLGHEFPVGQRARFALAHLAGRAPGSPAPPLICQLRAVCGIMVIRDTAMAVCVCGKRRKRVFSLRPILSLGPSV